MSRKRTKPRKDRRIFRKTAAKTKTINIDPKVYRGGIHL